MGTPIVGDGPAYARTPARSRDDLKLAADRADPIAHADQADPVWAARHIHPHPVVNHLKPDAPRGPRLSTTVTRASGPACLIAFCTASLTQK
jgi:hypothetical protein